MLKKNVVPPLTFATFLFLCILRHFLIFGFFCNDSFWDWTWFFCEHSIIACEGGGVRPIILMITIEASLRISSDLGMSAEVMEDARFNIVSVSERPNISDDDFNLFNESNWSGFVLYKVVLSCSVI